MCVTPVEHCIPKFILYISSMVACICYNFPTYLGQKNWCDVSLGNISAHLLPPKLQEFGWSAMASIFHCITTTVNFGCEILIFPMLNSSFYFLLIIARVTCALLFLFVNYLSFMLRGWTYWFTAGSIQSWGNPVYFFFTVLFLCCYCDCYLYILSICVSIALQNYIFFKTKSHWLSYIFLNWL